MAAKRTYIGWRGTRYCWDALHPGIVTIIYGPEEEAEVLLTGGNKKALVCQGVPPALWGEK
jgi:hypothetical protein